MTIPSRSFAACVGLLVLFLTGLGCAGSGTSLTHESAELRQESCPSGQQKTERDRGSATSCRPQRSWFQQVGDALSGAASAFRAPSP